MSSPSILWSNPVKFSPLSWNLFGYAGESFVGKGHGRKIRTYSPILQEAGSSKFDDDDYKQ